MIPAVVFLLTFGLAAAGPAWNGLGVKWSLNFIYYPEMQPRTVDEAVNSGFELVGSGTCGGNNNYEGIAYVKNGDYTVTLLFDVNGYIAGIQSGITVNDYQSSGEPTNDFALVLDGDINDRYVMSAYFINPSKICSTGRNQAEFEESGTGDNLYIQNGASSIMAIPYYEEDVAAPWVAGECFDSMGMHYWYDLSYDMDCDDLFPVFLLYDDGFLKGFGWAFGGDLASDYYEHPTYDDFDWFIVDVPQCLQVVEAVSTLHIYLDAHALDNLCWWPIGK